MKYKKIQSPPRVKDDLMNRGLSVLDDELAKFGMIINKNIATEIIDGGSFVKIEATDFWEAIKEGLVIDGGVFTATNKVIIDGGTFKWK